MQRTGDTVTPGTRCTATPHDSADPPAVGNYTSRIGGSNPANPSPMSGPIIGCVAHPQ